MLRMRQVATLPAVQQPSSSAAETRQPLNPSLNQAQPLNRQQRRQAARQKKQRAPMDRNSMYATSANGNRNKDVLLNMRRWNRQYSEAEAQELGQQQRRVFEQLRQGRAEPGDVFRLELALLSMLEIYRSRVRAPSSLDEDARTQYIVALGLGCDKLREAMARYEQGVTDTIVLSGSAIEPMDEALDIYADTIGLLSPITMTETLNDVLQRRGVRPLQWRSLV